MKVAFFKNARKKIKRRIKNIKERMKKKYLNRIEK